MLSFVKNYKKIFFVLLSVLMLSGTFAYAQINAQEDSTVSESTASIDLSNVKITSQTDNTFVIDFDISNRVGAQPDVKYGVALLKKDKNSTYTVDEKVYDETISLSPNSTVHKKVTYVAPSSEEGNYSIRLFIKNSNGIPYTLSQIDGVTLTKNEDVPTIDSTKCSILVKSGSKEKTYSVKDIISLQSSSDVSLDCNIINTAKDSVTVSSQVTQYINSNYGSMTDKGLVSGEVSTISSGETKTTSMPISVETKPGSYIVSVAFTNALKKETLKTVNFKYKVTGLWASIKSLRLDKDSYKAGDTATISFYASSGDGEFENTNTPLNLKLQVQNDKGEQCGNPVTQSLSLPLAEGTVNFPVNTTCKDPQVSAEITDDSQTVLYSQDYSITTSTPTKKSMNDLNNNVLAVLVLLIVVIGSWFLYIKTSGKTISVIVALLIFTSVLGINKAHASFDYLFYSCVGNCPTNTALWVMYDLDKSSYAPGENVILNVRFSSDDNPQPSSGSNICLYAEAKINSGLYSADLFPSPGCYSPQQLKGNWVFASSIIGQAPSTSGTMYVSMGSNGYRAVDGTLPINVTAAPTVQLWFSSLMGKMKNLSSNVVTSVLAMGN